MLRSYHNNEALKDKYVGRAQSHRVADRVVQSRGWDGFKGCFIGCLANDYPAHENLARDIGMPVDLLLLAEAIHDSLPGDAYKTWPERFASAVPVGVDLTPVRWQFLHWLLTDEAVNPGIAHDDVRDAVKAVAELCLSAALGDMPTENRWSAAESAAEAAADTAKDAARSAALSAAYSAAWSAEWSPWAASDSAVQPASWSVAWSLMAAKLIGLLVSASEDPHTEDGKDQRP